VETSAANQAKVPSRTLKKQNQTLGTLKKVVQNKGALIGLIVICVLIIFGIFAPWISSYGFADINVDDMYAKPSWAHPFGCDELGRDILSRVMYGGRYSLFIGLFATFLALVFGITLGSIVGYYGGLVDSVIMRVMDVIQAIPGMLLSIAISAVLGTGMVELAIALGVGNIAPFCRILRGSILTVRKSEYLDAAKADNTGALRMITKHILPNSISPIIVQATLGCANVILIASSLSFIGLGIQPPKPEWGAMLSAGRSFIRDYPHMLLFPGLAIALTVLSLNLIGDGLRDALDPKLKK
jgi:peptide/nickel transport system permease protein